MMPEIIALCWGILGCLAILWCDYIAKHDYMSPVYACVTALSVTALILLAIIAG